MVEYERKNFLHDFKSRVTIDLDSKSKIKLSLTLIKGLRTIPRISFIKIKPSNSKGYHIIFYSNKLLSKKKINQFRNKLKDDKLRQYYERDKKPSQILFSKKIELKNWNELKKIK